MKRFLLYFLAFAPLAVFAQLNGSGYYRVQNVYTERYISIVDTEAEVSTSGIDLRALHMLKPFEDSVAYNPATICYVDLISSSTCNIKGQGMDLEKATGGHVLTYLQRPDGTFWFYGKVGSGASVTKYLFDESYEDFAGKFPIVYYPNTDAGGKEWLVHPVTQSETNYFGVKPDVAATDGSCWATMYAGFPFKPSDASTKVYTVCNIDNARGYAVIEEVTGDVPAETPVLFLCGAATPSGNKLTLLDPNTTANSGTNYLQGNYYCNDVAEKTGHRNVREYNPKTMRMLGVDADGKPAFVKSSIKYLPANKAYLSVSSSAPDVLLIITKEDYAKGSQEATFDNSEKYSDVSDNTIDDAYFNLPSGDGYDASENAIVVNSTMTEEQLDAILKSDDPDAAIKSSYKGIILEVPASYGTITVNVKTKGSHVLMVKIGDNGTPKQIVNADGGQVNINYNVDKITKVYIYGAESLTSAAPARHAAGDNSVVLYGYKVSLGSTGIENIQVSDKIKTKEVWYTLDGRILQGKPTMKGLYIVNGKKVVIK